MIADVIADMTTDVVGRTLTPLAKLTEGIATGALRIQTKTHVQIEKHDFRV